MKHKVAFQSSCPSFVLPVVVLVIWCTGTVHSQSPGSRPIEFSEPRGVSGPSTNIEEFGAERRRLTDLEDRLAKTFGFLDFEDSMSGAPAPRVTRRVPVAPKRTKRTGTLVDDEDWAFSGRPSALEDLLDEGLVDRLFDQRWGDSDSQREEKLLEALRSEDWLVNGTMSDTFWEMPLVAEQNPNDRFGPDNERRESVQSFEAESTEEPESPPNHLFLRADEEDTSAFKAGDTEARSVLEGYGDGLFERHQRAESWSDPQENSFTSGNVYELGSPAQEPQGEARLEKYRALLGFDTKPERSEPKRTAVQHRSAFSFGSVASSGLPDTAPADNPWKSPYPITSAGTSSLLPVAPVAPSPPSLVDPLSAGQSADSASASAPPVSNPFFEPPRRPF